MNQCSSVAELLSKLEILACAVSAAEGNLYVLRDMEGVAYNPLKNELEARVLLKTTRMKLRMDATPEGVRERARLLKKRAGKPVHSASYVEAARALRGLCPLDSIMYGKDTTGAHLLAAEEVET